MAEAAHARRSPGAALQHQTRSWRGVLSGDGLILPAGSEDPECEPGSLQSSLAALQDADGCAKLLAKLDRPGLLDRRRHLLELRDTSTSHDWLWSLASAHGPRVPAGDWQMALRIRLGASLAGPGATCFLAAVPPWIFVWPHTVWFAPAQRLPVATMRFVMPCCNCATWRIRMQSASQLASFRPILCFAPPIFYLRRPTRAAWQQWTLE